MPLSAAPPERGLHVLLVVAATAAAMNGDAWGDPPPKDAGGMQRVKVYRLNSEGMWDDKGTGSVSVEYMEVRGMAMCASPQTTRGLALSKPDILQALLKAPFERF